MFDYIPEVFRTQYADDRGGGRPLVHRPGQQPAPAGAAAPRRGRPRDQLRGQGRPRHPRTAASSSTSSSRLPAEVIRKKLPSMYHQFKELADVDITTEPMEVGPTCHYVMGGVEVDPDTARRARARACSPPARCSGGMHGSNRLGGNSLSDLLVFGRRAGARRGGLRRRASARRGRRSPRPTSTRPRPSALAPVRASRGRREPVHAARGPAADDERPGRDHPHGEARCERRSAALDDATRSGPRRSGVEGHRQFNPGWHLALDLRNMLLVSRVRGEGGAGARRRAAAATPATTSRRWTRSGGRCNLVCSPLGDGRRRAGPPPAAAGDAAGPARPVRPGRAGEVPDTGEELRGRRTAKETADELRTAQFRVWRGDAEPAATWRTTRSR